MSKGLECLFKERSRKVLITEQYVIYRYQIAHRICNANVLAIDISKSYKDEAPGLEYERSTQVRDITTFVAVNIQLIGYSNTVHNVSASGSRSLQDTSVSPQPLNRPHSEQQAHHTSPVNSNRQREIIGDRTGIQSESADSPNAIGDEYSNTILVFNCRSQTRYDITNQIINLFRAHWSQFILFIQSAHSEDDH